MSPSAWRRLRLPSSRPDLSRPGGALRRGLLLPALACLSLLTVLAGTAAAQDVTFSSSRYVVQEGDTAMPELVLSRAASEDVTVHVEVFDFGARSGEDFAAGPWNVTVPAGQTRQSFSIATRGDYKAEGEEQFLLHISPSGHSGGVRRSPNGVADAIVAIMDSTKISARSASLRVVEGGTATIRLAIGTPARSAAFTIDYTLSGTTASAADVTGGFGARSVTVPARATSVEIPIETVQDTVAGEDVESFRVRLSTTASGVRFTTADIAIDIVDDDTTRISVPNPRVEVTEGATATVRVAVAYPKSTAFTLDYTLSGTTASAADVTGGFGKRSLTVPANATSVNISIATAQDTVHSEGVERVEVALSTTASSVVFDTEDFEVGIADDDTAASFASASSRTDERSRTHNVRVNLTPAPTSAITLGYTVGGTATDGSDYTAPSGTLSVSAGATTATIAVPILDDSDPEPTETVVLTLTGGSGYQVGDPGAHTLRIRASDVGSPPWVGFGLVAGRPINEGRPINSEQVNEDAGTHNVQVGLAWALPFDITVSYAVRDARSRSATSGEDYEPPSGTVTFRAGTTTATIPVTITDDNRQEGDERFFLMLTDGDDYRVLRVRSNFYNRELVILDNERLPRVFFASASQGVFEGAVTRDVTVNLRPVPDKDITLSYTVGGTATADSDYTALSGTLSVLAGATTATIPVPVLADSDEEGSETVILTLTSGTGYVLRRPHTHTLTIGDLPTVAFDGPNGSAQEASGTYKATVNLSPAPVLGFTLSYTVGGTATADSDYTALPGTLAVSRGATKVAIPVAITDDSDHEGGETVVLTLAAGAEYQVGAQGEHSLTIAASDVPPKPTVGFTLDFGNHVSEDVGTYNVQLRLSRTYPYDITVKYEVQSGSTATSGSDFDTLSGTVTVPAGATTATIPVSIIDDTDQEGVAEMLILALVSGEGYTLADENTRHSVRIHDNEQLPAVSFSSHISEAEEGAGTHNVTLNLSPAPDKNITVRYLVGGVPLFRPRLSSTSSSDYEPLSGRVTVLAGATTATIPVTIVDDGAHERSEALSLHLRQGTGYTPAVLHTHEIAITDDDPRIDVSFASASQSVVEGAGTRDITVNLSPAPTADITLGYTVGGTATADADYTALSGSVTVSAGATTATIPVAITDDSDPEGEETVVLTLTGVEGHRKVNPSTHTLTIAGSDGLTAASFASASQRAVERAGAHNVTVNLDPPPASTITLEYTVGGTATADADYAALSGTLSVPAGSAMATIPVTLLADDVPDNRETVVLTLAAGTGYWPASPRAHTLNILDLPAQRGPRGVFASNSQRVVEGSGTRDVTVNVNPPPAEDITVRYVVYGTATPGEDYEALSGMVSVPAGAATATIPVTILDDSTPEGEETVKLQLFLLVGGNAPGWNTHTLTIAASDGGTVASFATASQRVGGETGTHDVTVNLDPPPASPITLEYTVGGTATPGSDYTTLLGTLAVPAGSAMATIPVTLLADSVQEDPETVVLTLAAGTGYDLARPGKHTLTFGTVPTVAFPTYLARTSESVGTYRVPVRLTPPPTSAVTVQYSVVDRRTGPSATPGDDYQRLSGELSVPAGASKAYIPVTIIDDSVEDSGETVRLLLVGGTKYTHDSDGNIVWLDRVPGYRVGSRYDEFNLYITNHESGGLEGRVQVRLDAAVADGDGASANLWRRALAAVRGEAPPNGLARLTQADAQAQVASHVGSDIELALLWSEIAEAIGSGVTDPPAPEVPEITIAADAASVTEGTAASFTLTADPAPASPLDVTVTVAASGEFGITAGTQTVTIPATGSYTLTLATAGDEVHEADGSVSVTVDAGTGYTVGSSSGTVAIADDDAPGPEVTIAAGAGVTEGTSATFTLTADPAPAAPLDVTVTVATDGDYGITAGTQTVTIPTTGSATLTLATTGDDVDEADGSVSVTVDAGTGYTVGSASSGSVAIADDDDPAPETGTAHPAVDPALIAQIRAWMEAPGANVAARNERFTRVLAAFGVESHANPMTVAEAEGYVSRGWGARWQAIVDALKAIEAYVPPQQAADPEVTIAAGSGVTEGTSATFTLTADPAPSAALDVTVTVATDGDYGITAGQQTVTIPTTGSATLTLATAGDEVDEADGSVSVTVDAGTGYTVGSASSGSVAIADDDDPPATPDPEVTIAAGSGVTEGTSATFTLTASPAPTAALDVTVTVATSGDYGIATGTQTVTIPTSGSYVLTLATTGDEADEPDGSVSVTVDAGTGYTVGAASSGTVAIADDDLPPPVVTIAAGADVTEGTAATFTLTADPAPAAALDVTVTVAASGDYGIAARERTVTIPITGSATLTLATAGDEADEPDGSVSVTVDAGTGYTVGAASSGTVAIADDDLPPPEISVAAKAASVTEGGDAVFTVTADRAPAADLAVTLTVSEKAGPGSGSGTSSDFVAAADEGEKTVTVLKGETEAALTVRTVDDAVDEPNGSVTATVDAGTGYTVASSPANAASVAVADNDAAGVPTISVEDVTVQEGGTAVIPVTLAPAPTSSVRLLYRTMGAPRGSEGYASFSDFKTTRAFLHFLPGETLKHARVRTRQDSHDDGGEWFEVLVMPAGGNAVPAAGVYARVTIENDDPMPGAYLARFGRTVAEQALDGIAGRMSADRTPGMQGSVAGQALTFDPAASDQAASAAGATPVATGAPGTTPVDRQAALAMADIARGLGADASAPAGPGSWSPGSLSGAGGASPGSATDPFGAGHGWGNAHGLGESRTMTARDALLGSSFSLTGQKDGAGGSLAFWGRASQARFDGADRGDGTDIRLDGTVTTGMLGADYARGNWLVGLALTQSSSEGSYAAIGGGDEGDGDVEASLTAAIPYAALRASERLKLWGAAGYGAGEVTLKTMGKSYSADTSWTMAAAGVRGDLLEAPQEGSPGSGSGASGFALALTSDALWARTSSDKTGELNATDSDVTRLRLGLEGSYRIAMEDGASLVPKLEIGARHDGGDAETGFGVELGGGVQWVDPSLGLSLDLSGRTLLAHENDDLKDRGFSAALAFDPAPATGRGPSLSLRQDFGGQAQGGLDALFVNDPLEDRAGSEATSRWAMEAAYGFPVFGDRFTGSPHVGLGLATGARDYSLGWRLTPEAATAPDLSFGLKATRRESDTAEAEHVVGFEIRASW